MKKNNLFYVFCLITLSFTPGCFESTTNVTAIEEEVVDCLDSNYTLRWSTQKLNAGAIDIHISEDFSDSETTYIENMAEEWETAVPYFNFFTYTTNAPNKDYSNPELYYDSEIGIYKSVNWPYSADALAVTVFKCVKNGDILELIHSDIILNYQNHVFTDISGDNSKYDLPSVVLHELGHLLGEGHESVYDSVMYPTFQLTDEERILKPFDISSIKIRYPNPVALLTANDYQAAMATPNKNYDPLNRKDVVIYSGVMEMFEDGCVGVHQHD